MMPAALSCDCKSWRGLLPFGRPCRLRGQATFHRAADSFRAARNSVRRLPRRRPVLLDASQLSLDPGSRSILPTMPNQAIRAEADGGAARRSALVGRTTCSRIPLLRRVLPSRDVLRFLRLITSLGVPRREARSAVGGCCGVRPLQSHRPPAPALFYSD
jgi:hypothetical protein